MDDQEEFGVPQAPVQCQRILSMLGENVLGRRPYWIHVGQCLFNILAQDGKELFERYTVPQFRDQLEEIWASYQRTRHGLPSLKTMASRHNKARYDEWVESVAKAAAIGALEETSAMTEIADIVKFMYDHCFICTNVVSQEWWYFNGTYWQKMSGGHTMQQRFSRKISPIFKEIYEATRGPDEDKDVKRLKDKAAQITRGLKDPGFKRVLLTECSQIFMDEDFTTYSDENHFIMGTPNGVLELKEDRMYLREAYPEDWITLQTGVPYDSTLSWEHPDVQYVMKFFKQVLYKPDLIDFSLKHKSTCLLGGNLDKLFVMNIGTTANNAKTTCASFDRYVFGKYSGKLPLGVIVGKTPEQGATTPALAQTKGTRLQQFDEPSKKQEFNASFTKALTGNDEMWVRALYSQGSSFIPQFKTIMYGNDAPHNRSEGGDKGMEERAVWVPHDSRFTFDAPDDEEEQWKTRTFKANPHIKIELSKRGSAYLWILVEYLKRWYKEGLKKPDEVIEKTKAYHRANDVFTQFKVSEIEVTEYKLNYIPQSELYTKFKTWFSDSYPGPSDRIPTKDDFVNHINRLLGQPEGDEKRYHGIKLKNVIKAL